jgi:hypothetical protein
MPTQVRNNFGCSRDNESISNISVRIDSNNNLKKWNYDISELFFHEFSHPIINPLSDKYLGDISSPLSEKTLKALEERAYCNGPCYFDESVIRAMTIIYHDYVSKSDADEEEYIQDEEEIGFVHTRLLLKKLKEFEKQDKSIEEFYPQLKDVFLTDVENMSASDEHQ